MKKIIGFSSGRISKKLGRSHHIFKKHSKVQNLGAFSTFFFQKTPNLNQTGCFSDHDFVLFCFVLNFWLWMIDEGNTTFLLSALLQIEINICLLTELYLDVKTQFAGVCFRSSWHLNINTEIQAEVSIIWILYKFVNLKSYSVILTAPFYDIFRRYTQKSLFPKFWLIPILCFQVVHDYVCFIALIDYCVELRLADKTFGENCSHFMNWNDFSRIPLGKCGS